MDGKKIALLAAAVLLASALYAAWLWQPERQVRLHTAHFLKAVERRKWDTVQSFVAENYSDRWGHDKDFVLREMREVFRQFFYLEIQAELAEPTVAGGIAEISSPIKIAGDGSPIAHFVVEKVNVLLKPFVFTWTQPGWQPWVWRLTKVEQPELELPRDRDL